MLVMLSDLTPAIQRGRELTAAEITAAAIELLRDDTTSIEAKIGFLRALALRGETAAELTGFVREFLQQAIVPPLDLGSLDRPAIDVCGTGGDKLGLFNVSTTAMFVLAGAGVAVVKHGNRGITSPSGSADVLAALGGKIDLTPDRFAEGIRTTGVAFMLAPQYHPAFKAVASVRQKLAAEGQRTMFNLIGPLLNPMQPKFQIAGVFEAGLVPAYAAILASLGRTRAWAVHGESGDGRGMDELSTLGHNRVMEAAAGTVRPIEFTSPLPRPASLNQLAGGNAATNAEILESLVRGEIRGPRRDLVLLNAAAGLIVCGLAPDLGAGIGHGRRNDRLRPRPGRARRLARLRMRWAIQRKNLRWNRKPDDGMSRRSIHFPHARSFDDAERSRTRDGHRWVRYLYFGGTGYLGLAAHPEVIEAGCQALRDYGVHSATSRGRFGTTPPVRLVEERAAAFFGVEDAFYFGSGYVANHILVASLGDEIDAILSTNPPTTRCGSGPARGATVVTFRRGDAADLAENARVFAGSW